MKSKMAGLVMVGLVMVGLVMVVSGVLSGSGAETSYKRCKGERAVDVGQGAVAWTEWVRTKRRKRQPYRNLRRGHRQGRKRRQRLRRRMWYLLAEMEQQAKERDDGRDVAEEAGGTKEEMQRSQLVNKPIESLEMRKSWVRWKIELAGRWG